MKKFLFILLTALLVVSCTNPPAKEPTEIRPDLSNTDFIYIKDNHFHLRNEPFFMLMLNYVVTFRSIDDRLVVGPSKSYEMPGEFEANTIEENNNQVSGHFKLIKEMGFNTIRVTFDGDRLSHFLVDENYDNILNGYKEFIDIATKNDLRVIILIKAPFEEKYEKFTCSLLSFFKDNPTIIAYDFINEPLYFDPVDKRDKVEAYKIQVHWKEMMRQYANNQLFTIGFSEPIEVFEWDPTISPVDFISVHTYNPLRAKSELYWYSTYCNKPWILGETALPSDNDSITYDEQKLYAEELLNNVAAAGGAGFGWWDFQEDLGQSFYFEAAYSGLLNHEGFTYTKDSSHKINGTLKPVVDVFKNFTYQFPNSIIPIQKPINFDNNLGYHNYLITGTILDNETKEPIEGAVIRAWSPYWDIAWNTYSDKDGNFQFYSNIEMEHYAISAPSKNLVSFSKLLTYTKENGEPVDTFDLPDKNREYHKTSFANFLISNDSSVFHFDPEKFNKYKYKSSLGTIYLKSLNLK